MNKINIVTLATFIELESYRNKQDSFIDIGRPRNAGGTGILNINANETDIRAALNVFKEMKCNCLFVCPQPVFGLVPFNMDNEREANQKELEKRFESCLSVIPPPYISIHQYRNGSEDCVRLFKTLMIQELAATDKESDAVRDALNDATMIIHNIMKKE